jgi:hypothetical protein
VIIMLRVHIFALLLLLRASSHAAHAALPLPQQSVRYQSAHFVLLAPAGGDVGTLLDEMERAYRDLRGFGLKMPPTITARSYGSTGEFVRASGAGAFNLGIAVAERIHLQPLQLLLRRGDLGRVLRHELTHVALVAAARRGLPRWMNEGVAMVAASEKQPEKIRFTGLDRLESVLSRSRSHDTLRSAYGTAERLVSRLMASGGKEKLLGLLRSVGSGGDFEEGFRGIVGMEAAEWGRRELAGRR